MNEIRLPDAGLTVLHDIGGVPRVTLLPCDRLLDTEGAEYMRRYHLRQGKGIQDRFHLIQADDPGRDFHDHPWDYSTQLLEGAYIEHTPDGSVTHTAPCMLTRRAEALHRLELVDGPVWTYFVTGRWRRNWGFLTGYGWVHNRAYRGAGRVTGCEPDIPGRAW